MNRFEYARADSIPDALRRIAETPGAAWIAGGTTILDLMKLGITRPSALIDLNGLDLRCIADTDAGISIGSQVRMSDAIAHRGLAERMPLIAQALAAGASPQLRNMASIGGNLMQRTRCPYFRDPATPCNKRSPGAGCSALGGSNRRHAVLGASEHCISVHASDLAVALAAAGARVRLVSAAGERDVDVAAFYVLPGEHPEIESILGDGELIAGVFVPEAAVLRRSVYRKVRDRASYDFALVSVAAALDVRDGRIADARIALGGVAPVPWRARRAEAVLQGAEPTRDLFVRAAAEELAPARSYGENEFKIPLAQRLIVRALGELAEGA